MKPTRYAFCGAIAVVARLTVQPQAELLELFVLAAEGTCRMADSCPRHVLLVLVSRRVPSDSSLPVLDGSVVLNRRGTWRYGRRCIGRSRTRCCSLSHRRGYSSEMHCHAGTQTQLIGGLLLDWLVLPALRRPSLFGACGVLSTR